jgi:hypothetical protein
MDIAYIEKNKKVLKQQEKLPSILNTKFPPQEKIPENFKYVTNNIRRQIMIAFLNFNPIIHFKNLNNILAKLDPEIQKDINSLKENIEKDSAAYMDPYYYRKKWLKIKNNNEKFKKKQEEKIESLVSSTEMPTARQPKKKPSIKMYKNILSEKNRKKGKDKFEGNLFLN